MPRRNHDRRVPRTPPRAVGGATGWARTEDGPGGDYLVRNVPGSQATKTYRCPGCDHEIQPGISHVVAWPAEEYGSSEQRRHWHTGCWNGRHTRRPAR
ncbi:hypothetical protein D5S17_34295 [Pseudonocardiaceae bacterium YIM PH 21723]|nr:hypothetical protein D5S17_34295 [Pseudonocardiaceae bacterium YIM PH 21723]